jgi:chaperonin cofactor prefoldin
MNHPGFTLNSIKRTGARLKALRERRKHIENQIEELQDKLYIIDGEIVALGTV